jgi:hypothetical protein
MKAWESGFKDPDVLAVARKVSVIEIPGPDSSETRPVPGQGPKAPPRTVKTKDGKTYRRGLGGWIIACWGTPKNVDVQAKT